MEIPHDPYHDLRANCLLCGYFISLEKKSVIWSDVLVQDGCKELGEEGEYGAGKVKVKWIEVNHQKS